MKTSRIQQRIQVKQQEKYLKEKQLKRPIWDEYREIYMKVKSTKTTVIELLMASVSEMLSANEVNQLLTDYDLFELNGAMKLLSSDCEFYDQRLDEIYASHQHKKGSINIYQSEEALEENKLILNVAQYYTDAQRFYDTVVSFSTHLITEIIARFEKRQSQISKTMLG